MNESAKKPKKTKRGPQPDRLKLQGNWTESVKKALQKPRPAGGWPTSGQK